MKKYYGQIIKMYSYLAVISAIALIAGGIVVSAEKNIVGAIEIAAGAVILISAAIVSKRRKDRVGAFLDIVSKNSGAISANIMSSFPIPVAVSHIDGTISWYNEQFSELFKNKNMFDAHIETMFSDIKWGEVLKSASRYEKRIRIEDKRYLFIASAIRDKRTSPAEDEDKVSIYIYLIDRTVEAQMKLRYNNEKTDVAIINIDNYDDVLQRVNDNEQQQVLSQIRRCVNEWAMESGAIVKNTDRDRYYVLFEHRYLSQYINNKFDILYKVRKVGEDINLPVSISIGIGISGSLSENDTNARNALDMALGRGGDQVSVKDDTQYKFYGSKARDYEKSTRVKTRAFAVALKDFIKNSDKVIFMGHAGADYDSFGAAMGLQRAVRTLGKKPYIIYDNNSPAVKQLYDELRTISEYKGMFISGDDALEVLSQDTLVVILDTHRPSMLPCPWLVERASKVVLIDHHRRSTDFINPCSLIYHEPYASSTCEMATELLEYMDMGSSLTTVEAQCLYTGILMDTKNFILKTGVRTFEAASYLRRLGLNTVDVKKLFNVSKDDYDHKVDIVKTARVIAPKIALATCNEKFPNIKVIASQAADEMLNISGIHASIVMYPMENQLGISARSLGDINVQVIMEYLGGGGHSTVAGAQISDKNVNEVIEAVEKAVKDYLKNNEN